LKVEEPTSYREAIDSAKHKEWMDAMRDEMDSMGRNKVWKPVDLPPQLKSIRNKWVFKIKYRVDGTIDKFKARLVSKEFTEIEGVDYKEIFFHVVRFSLFTYS